MATHAKEPARDTSRVMVYLAVGVFVAGLLVASLLRYRVHASTAEARAKAAELSAALASAGLQSPSVQVLARVFGTDGGAVCADPGAALSRATADQQLSNGAAQVGVRPVRAGAAPVLAESLVLQVYCPDQLAEFEEYVDGLDLEDA